MNPQYSRLVMILILLAALTVTDARADTLAASQLKCEYLTDPLGIDVVRPRLNWRLESPERNQTQSAYQILVASSKEILQADRGDLWDSGKVASDSSQHIPYAGTKLRSGMRCYWKVRVWDRQGNGSSWTPPASWEMGLLLAGDWKASWIGSGEADDVSTTTAAAPYLRHTFKLAKPIKSARAYFCGLGFGELWLNGGKVGDHVLSPNQTDYDQRTLAKLIYPLDARTATKRVPYVTYDVTSQMRQGVNAVGAILGNGWYNQRDRRVEGCLWYGAPRMMLQIQIEFDDGSVAIVKSDGTWKTATGPLLHDGIFTGEIYDARLEKSGWCEPGYDDASWREAQTMRTPSGALVAQSAPPDKVMATLKPLTVEQIKPGVWVYDMGQNMAGWVRLKIQEPRGTTITLRYQEDQGQDSGQADTYIASGKGTEQYEPRFTWHAFRRVEVAGCSGPLTVENLVGCEVHTAVEPAGSFSCSNPLFNQIFDIYRRTQLCNMHGGVPSDCPHRERLGYTGDGQLSAEAAIYSFDMSRFYTKWIRDIADAQNKTTGFVPHTAPMGGGGGGPAWGSAMVLMPWYFYLYYGDRQILEDYYAGMKQWVAYLGTRTDQNGIVVREEPGGWCLGDWCAPGKTTVPPELVNTCYYGRVAQLVSRIAGILDKPEEAARFARLAEKIAADLNARFLDPKNGAYSIGRQGADVFPLAFGFVPEGSRKLVFDHLTRHLESENDGHLDTGILATPLLLDVLTAQGRVDLAGRIMNQTTYPSFGHMIAKGASTLWETWDGGASHNHPMFGSVCAWFFNSLAGLAPDAEAPGFKNIIVKPHVVAGLTSATAEYDSTRGKIAVRWKILGQCFKLELIVPTGSTATVFLPGEQTQAVTESGQPAAQSEGVRFLRAEGDRLVYNVGSGHYFFEMREWK